MSGMIRGSGMNKAAEYCKISEGIFPLVAEWISFGLGEVDSKWIGSSYYTMAIIINDKLVGGVVFHDYRVKHDVWLTIYTTDRKWCNRKVLRRIFNFVFEDLKCQRASVLVDDDNEQSLNLVKRLGFRQEGFLRCFRENGKNAVLLGMLKNECKWKD